MADREKPAEGTDYHYDEVSPTYWWCINADITGTEREKKRERETVKETVDS